MTGNVLFSKVHPWCIGRFVFDRPITSEISDELYEFRGERLETFHKATVREYDKKVMIMESELRAKRRVDPGKRNAEIDHSWLEVAFSPVNNSRVFIFKKIIARIDDLPFDAEGYVFSGDTLFHTTGEIGATAVGQSEAIYGDIYRRIKARDNWTVPTESGFCFDGGIVTGSSTYTEEVSQSFALLPGRPALLLIKMRDSVSDDRDYPLTRDISGLRARLDGLPGRYRILRQGKRLVAGMDAEEVLFALHDGTVSIYQFYLLAPGNPATLAQPHTEIQLLLGAPPRGDLPANQATSPVDEAGALQLWDALLNSLRLRPGAV